ncbi:MAG TPA: dihydroorotate dehydrogenase electron transfer subunit [Woeseiaceae bacterium]|nr:dihydroorotate dehydrogenase electron transfer subunit [Woeseiaceae bacterium]
MAAPTAAKAHAQRNRNTIFVEDGILVASEAFPGDQFVQRIRAPKCAATAEPGMFVHVTCADALPMRRPLSIMRAGEDWIEILFKNVGNGMRALSRKQTGDMVSILGPIGVPFGPEPRHPLCLLVGGGVGIPPMVFLADRLRHDSRYRPVAILGSELPFPFERARSRLAVAGVPPAVDSTLPLLESWGVPARLTSLAGFDGCHRGFVTDLARLWLEALPAAERAAVKIFACGPMPMLRAVAALAEAFGVACEVSLEEYMACAVGGCAGCAVPVMTPSGKAMKRVCVDGPVFDARAVVW